MQKVQMLSILMSGDSNSLFRGLGVGMLSMSLTRQDLDAVQRSCRELGTDLRTIEVLDHRGASLGDLSQFIIENPRAENVPYRKVLNQGGKKTSRKY